MLKTNGKSKQHVKTHEYCKQWGGNFKKEKEMLEIEILKYGNEEFCGWAHQRIRYTKERIIELEDSQNLQNSRAKRKKEWKKNRIFKNIGESYNKRCTIPVMGISSKRRKGTEKIF